MQQHKTIEEETIIGTPMITPRPVRQSKNPMISPDSAIAFHVAGCAAAHTMMMMAKMKMTSLISGVGAGSDSLYDWPIRRLLHLSAKVERRMSLRTIARHSIRQTRAPPRTRCGCAASSCVRHPPLRM